ncbi:MAG: hypothetical protein ACP5L5_10965 [Vulcanisaeta sp.]|uniref:hypothetical protein n=1 Tax=Vulcanisaeta sp. TaxID=2020871 RepID=UPI003D0D42EB
MTRVVKIEIDFYLFIAILLGAIIIVGLVAYGVSTYYMNNLIEVLGYVPCKAPSLPKTLTIYPIPGNEDWLAPPNIPGVGSAEAAEFYLNGTYYITSEFYLEPGVYVCVTPMTTWQLLAFGSLNSTFVPSNDYGYIKCVTGNGPTWLNVTLGPGAYAFVIAVYGSNITKPILVKALKPAVAVLITDFVPYPQCGYPSFGRASQYVQEEKAKWFYG